MGYQATIKEMQLYNILLNKNDIPKTWKLTNIIPILKPSKDKPKENFYVPIDLLPSLAKTLE